ncbi:MULTISPECIES: hypothetical protein [Burkholderia]|uniref:hypothetical protein n=1 Tax=Burkholderia TaxID=32008 RepID=UPI001178B2A5|nr:MULTISPECIES: hypothetical protein [Burkholderia]EKS9796173.1 hypothetical protein [Burkholderia cepacia]EKS9806091.1 hypothetical protein [Burkholderia cepacia]EKS9814452.1 hypothetical protein [Burkholderia cepacia]EKS9821772.1 hypothetical protein [Burkholderia cepacia]EKS9829393.1 hypothetical protein [Burkholderia cepacia]
MASGVAQDAGQEESGAGVGEEQRGASPSFLLRRMIERCFVAALLFDAMRTGLQQSIGREVAGVLR